MKTVAIIIVGIALCAWGFSGTIHRTAVAITKIASLADNAASTTEQAAREANAKIKTINK